MEETPIEEGFDNAQSSSQNVGESALKQEEIEEEAAKVVQKQASGESSAIIDSETGEHESI